MRCYFLAALLSPALLCSLAFGQEAAKTDDKPKVDTSRGDLMIAAYFANETDKLKRACLAEIDTLDDWNAKKGEYRRQLLEMLGLDPLPEKTDLKAEVTGRVEADEFVVENVHFQSRPGLYVTGNLYLPKKVDKPLPAILYLCGHGAVKKGNVSFGNKVHYQHHGAWFARNGYVCLTIDSLQLGEIEGIHHGTHRYGMWWWLNRGYTPAGVEAWNCVRALDYLETRPEVDKEKFGVTGRSGGGAYSWWIAAIDERIKAAVPVAGITDLRNHVVDGCVEGHCDCMYMVNTYRWDYALVAALVAPRPLLISNTDSDYIFPLDGVYRTFEQVRRIYRLHEPALKGASANVALNISPGPHKDTQELQIHAFRWFDKHLKGEERLIEKTAVKFFEPEQLKVFKTLPADQKNTEIHETFVRKALLPKLPAGKAEFEGMRDAWMYLLREKSIRGDDPLEVDARVGSHATLGKDNIHFATFGIDGERGLYFTLFVLHRADLKNPELVVLNVLDAESAQELANIRTAMTAELEHTEIPASVREGWDATKKMLASSRWVMAYVYPRGVEGVDPASKKDVQIRRRYYLLGQTQDESQVFDVRRAIQAVRSLDQFKDVPLWLQSQRNMAGVTLYASLFEPDIKRLDLYDLPKKHRDGPYFLNVERVLDMPQAVAMAAERSKVVIYQDDDAGWEYPQAVAEKLGWDAKQIQVRKKP